jgi:hypothetical protein
VRVNFDVFIESEGANFESWPGRTSMGTELLGRIPLAKGGTVCVVAHVVPHEATSYQLPSPLTPDQVAAPREQIRAADGAARIALFGTADDGAPWMKNGPVEAASDGS